MSKPWVRRRENGGGERKEGEEHGVRKREVRKGGRGAWGGYFRHEIVERATMVTHFRGCPVLEDSISSNLLSKLHVLKKGRGKKGRENKKEETNNFLLQTVVHTHTHTHTHTSMYKACVHTFVSYTMLHTRRNIHM